MRSSGTARKASTRSGPPGGLVTARFRHYEARSGMPLLHDHLLLSVKGQRLDGKWGSIHSEVLFENTVAASSLYNEWLDGLIRFRNGFREGGQEAVTVCGWLVGVLLGDCAGRSSVRENVRRDDLKSTGRTTALAKGRDLGDSRWRSTRLRRLRNARQFLPVPFPSA
ncbi:relaxase domain-containing protein [Streptomyces sp. 5.8]|uniref:relaxase domain-containing protein n=1 Tax=Streptomyces sp. 5.8 TaxID=3406571 RepID=UPI003BB7F46F